MRHFTLPYSDAFGTGARPYLVLHVTAPSGKSGNIWGLIDSGADATSLPLGFASLMGYRPTDLDQREAQQVSGKIDVWVPREPCRAELVGLPDYSFDLTPTFVDGSTHALWGRADFFSAFGVEFDETARCFILTVPDHY